MEYSPSRRTTILTTIPSRKIPSKESKHDLKEVTHLKNFVDSVRSIANSHWTVLLQYGPHHLVGNVSFGGTDGDQAKQQSALRENVRLVKIKNAKNFSKVMS
ncbi:uncharacterized protein LOC119768610 [Culex quinquefasciatus]|uniref:uncharacterized protein LOC119768610 n=1 Tax=Culex quinquefasciatus TaxID=7176 RepID=UPI0018E36281|nr:uncharacterized protein LOC119768610 [Culex quinquefasciatus]